LKDKKKSVKILPIRVYFEGNKRVQRGVLLEKDKNLKEALHEIFSFEDYNSLKVTFLIFSKK